MFSFDMIFLLLYNAYRCRFISFKSLWIKLLIILKYSKPWGVMYHYHQHCFFFIYVLYCAGVRVYGPWRSCTSWVYDWGSWFALGSGTLWRRLYNTLPSTSSPSSSQFIYCFTEKIEIIKAHLLCFFGLLYHSFKCL